MPGIVCRGCGASLLHLLHVVVAKAESRAGQTKDFRILVICFRFSGK